MSLTSLVIYVVAGTLSRWLPGRAHSRLELSFGRVMPEVNDPRCRRRSSRATVAVADVDVSSATLGKSDGVGDTAMLDIGVALDITNAPRVRALAQSPSDRSLGA
jgi:hypothetical protein